MDKWYKLLKAYDDHAKGEVVQMDDEDAGPLVKAGILEETEVPEDNILTEQREELRKALKSLAKQAIAEAFAELKPDADGKESGNLRVEILGPVSRNLKNYGYDEGWTPYFHDVRTACANGAQAKLSDRLKGLMDDLGQKAPSGMGELIGEDGGFLVPPELNASIFEKVLDEVNLVAMADMYSTSGNSMEFNSLVENSRASGSRHGGVRGYWLGEGAQLTGSKPKFSKIKLKLEKLGVFITASDELLEDSGLALEQYLTRMAGKEIAFLLGDALINGDGIAKPLGIINAACSITVTRGTATTVKFADISAMWSRMPASYRQGAVWLANQEVEPQLDSLFGFVKNVAGTENVGGWPIYLPPGGISEAPYGRLKGRPVMLTEWNPALGTTGDLCLCQWNQYAMLSKGGIKSAMSIHLRFDYDESVFRFTFRVDGQPWWPSALTPYKGSNTLSPFVLLGAA
jgi:HK97 family phage major capsid protein